MEVNGDVINEYFNNLEDAITDVRPENLYNYDETNLTDAPSSKLSSPDVEEDVLKEKWINERTPRL